MKCLLLFLKHLKIVTVRATTFIFFAKWSDFDIHDNNSPAISVRVAFVRKHGKARLPLNMEPRLPSLREHLCGSLWGYRVGGKENWQGKVTTFYVLT